jgi:hypothetical protein
MSGGLPLIPPWLHETVGRAASALEQRSESVTAESVTKEAGWALIKGRVLADYVLVAVEAALFVQGEAFRQIALAAMELGEALDELRETYAETGDPAIRRVLYGQVAQFEQLLREFDDQ